MPVQAYRGATASAAALETVVFEFGIKPAAFAAGDVSGTASADLRRWQRLAPSVKQALAMCLVLAENTGRVLLVQRTRPGLQDGAWGTWIGAIDDDRQPVHASALALGHAIGYDGEFSIIPLRTHCHERSIVLHHHIALVPDEFAPTCDGKALPFMWCRLAELPRSLDPYLVQLLDEADGDLRLIVDFHSRVQAMLNIEL